MENYFVSTTTGKVVSIRKVKKITKRLEEITEEEAKKHTQMCTPLGMEELLPTSAFSGIEHCVYLGLINENNFEKKVKYYVKKDPYNLPQNDYRRNIVSIIGPILPPFKKFVVVDFYGDKK